MHPFQYAIRIYWPSVNTRTKLDRALRNLREHRAACDAVCILTEGDCMDVSYISPEEYQKRAQWMRCVVDVFRQEGFHVHINVMITYGHCDEEKVDAPTVPYPTLVGHDGVKSATMPCPNSDGFKAYIAEKYRQYALCGPDYLWIDDDVRMQFRHPVQYGCFCETCLQKFNALHGSTFSRATLASALAEDHYPEPNDTRLKWLAFNRMTMRESLETIRSAVRAVNPGVVLGFMSVDIPFGEYSAHELALYGEILTNAAGCCAYRPGGFFYDDSRPMGAVYKGISIARQVAASKRGSEFLSEVEGIPYETLQKSPAFTAFEIACHIGLGGATGIAANLMECMGNEWTEQTAYLKMLSERRPFFQTLAESLAGHVQKGFFPYTHELQWAYRTKEEAFMGFRETAPRLEQEKLIELGIPLCYNLRNSLGILVSGQTARSISEDTLREFAGKSIYADGEAVQSMMERYHAEELFGVECCAIRGDGLYEKFNNHGLNGPYSGYNRDGHFYSSEVGSRGLVLRGAEPLTDLLDYFDKPVGCHGVAVYENRFGGRAAVVGFAPWSHIHFLHKRRQITEILDWLSRGGIPCRILSPYKIAQAVWESADDAVIVLYNCSFQPADELLLQIRYEGRLEELNPDGRWTEIKGKGAGVVSLCGFAPWSVRTLRVRFSHG